jgi:hypothetical protein
MKIIDNSEKFNSKNTDSKMKKLQKDLKWYKKRNLKLANEKAIAYSE